jgi:hypothetical protein
MRELARRRREARVTAGAKRREPPQAAGALAEQPMTR